VKYSGWPLRGDPASNQFDLPGAQGRIWFSTRLLSMGTAPSAGPNVSSGNAMTYSGYARLNSS
jgi:hypothetical protein